MIRDGYLARWRDREYDASPDGERVRLYLSEPAEDFTEVEPGRYARVVPAGEVTELVYVRTVCSWHGQPFIVLAAQDGWLRLEYIGGRWPVAQALGLEAFEYGVYQGWARAAEVTGLQEHRV
ncbi:hypothetical protein [Plantactinospora sp. KBS50]|uniref:hypothetical protein n=1 Tax=Plantactinospora sp. KBS50 TaxID=2024580 RepID=UPI000BAB10DB|nr:hypothetical protein [Plantactinospora sp. KBS50]ASW53237.1 hypothetical protein CIK06_02155 [Plantactinospora sp. KBS50]